MKVKLSVPWTFGFGVYVTFGAVPLSVPFAGVLATANVSESPSASVPVSVIAFAVSSSVATVCASARGASLTAATAIDTVADEVPPWPSLTVKVKLSAPLKPGFGV